MILLESVCSTVFYMGFRPQVVFVHIYMYPDDIMLTEFAKHIWPDT